MRIAVRRVASVATRSFAVARCFTAPAAAAMAAGSKTVFERIVAREIPAAIVYEDETAIAFRDLSPAAPTHVLVVPKVLGRLTQLQHASKEDRALLGHLMWVAGEVARVTGIAEGGYRVVVNDGKDGLQSVYHLHLHVIGAAPPCAARISSHARLAGALAPRSQGARPFRGRLAQVQRRRLVKLGSAAARAIEIPHPTLA